MNRQRIVMLVAAALTACMSVWAADVKVEFVTPSIVHVVKGQPTKTLVVTLKPQQVAVTQKGNTWKSSELTVKLDPKSQSLTFMTSKGKVLLKEQGWSLIRKNIDDFEVSQTFTLDKDEAIYGLGTVQDGKLNRRGLKKRMEQSNLEDFQNVLQSIKGYGIYWENYSPTMFEDNAQGMTFTSEAGQGIDYYFMYGGSADGVIAQVRQLTGDVPMFPYGPTATGSRRSAIRLLVKQRVSSISTVLCRCRLTVSSRTGSTGVAITCGMQWISCLKTLLMVSR